ncbi:MAG: YfiR family protein, partial [Cyclobacteriaceae bacterium]|nr:YfiR family protein [Cyclobacteriaceae bacterium]
FSTIKDISKCNMLFIPEALSGQVPEILKKIKGTAIMMITEKEGLALKGSCVNFISSQGKLAFELNSNAMDEAGLKASKELTKYAIVL